MNDFVGVSVAIIDKIGFAALRRNMADRRRGELLGRQSGTAEHWIVGRREQFMRQQAASWDLLVLKI